VAAATCGITVAAGAGVGVRTGDGTGVGAVVGVKVGVTNTVAVASGVGLNVAAARVGVALGGWVGVTGGEKLAEPALAVVAAGDDAAPVRGGLGIADWVGVGVLGLDAGVTVAVRVPLVPGAAVVLDGVEAVATAPFATSSRVPRLWPQAARKAPLMTRVAK